MVSYVLVMGDSYVHRLDDFTNNLDNGLVNLGFDGTRLQVSFCSVGGGTLYPGRRSLQRHLEVIDRYNPRSIFLHLGGNDLSNGCDPCTEC